MNQSRSSEELLMDFVRSREEESFRELVIRHLPLVYTTALRVTNGDKHLSEDVAQMVFSDLALKAERLPSNTIVAGWLYQHTWFTSAKTIRTERRRQLREQQSLDMGTALPDTRHDDPDRLRPILDDALTSLKSQERDALVLRFFENADFRRVGETLGVSEDAAQKRVSRSLDKLREILSARAVTVSVAALTAFLAKESSAAPIHLASQISTGALGVTATSSAAWLYSLTSSTKAKLALAATLAGAVTAPLVWQGKTISSLNGKIEAQSSEIASLNALRAENDELRKRVLSEQDLEKLKAEFAELQRLRGEVTLLRRHAAATSENQTTKDQTDANDEEQPEILSVFIQARVAELSHERMAELLQNGFPPVGDPKNFTMTVDKEIAESVFRMFEETEGIDLVAAPRVSTADGRDARIAVTDDILLPSGEKLPVGFTADFSPAINKNTMAVKLKIDVKVTEFLGWANEEQTIPRARTRSAQQDITLEHGQVLMMGRSVLPHEGEATEPKLQIYCFDSSAIDARGEPVAMKANHQ